MKTTSQIIQGIAVMILFSLVTTAIIAQNPDRTTDSRKVRSLQTAGQDVIGIPPPPPPPPPQPVTTPDDQTHPQAPRLDLPGMTVEQTGKIQEADLAHVKVMTPLKNQIREKKARLQTLLTSNPFDERSADQVAEDIGKIEGSILKELIRHDQFLKSLLTPQQQIIFDSRSKPFLQGKNKGGGREK